MLVERTVTCPACWEPVDLQLDLSGENQDYIEDCAVCCRPMRITYTVHAEELAELQVESAA